MIYLFLDTNILMHYKDFEQINWSEIFNEEISIILSPTVIEEIDDIKDRDSNAKKKKKAKSLSAKIADYLLYDKHGKYPVKTCYNATREQFEDKQFNIDKKDDWFILSAIRFMQEQSENIIIVAADNTVLYKSKMQGIPYHILSEEYLQFEEPSEEEKEITILKKELERYKNRQSKPQITFENNTNKIFLTKPPILDIEKIIEDEIRKEKLEYPYYPTNDGESLPPGNGPVEIDLSWVKDLSVISSIYQPSNEQIDNYNSDLDEYFKEYAEYIRLIKEYEVLSSYLYKLKTKISNDGTSPTGKLNVFLKFPSNVILYNKQNIKTYRLNPPIKPQKELNQSLFSSRDSAKLKESLKQITSGLREYTHQGNPYWDLSKKANSSYKFSYDDLNHKIELPIDLNDLRFDLRNTSNFKIQYTIIDASLIDPIEGELHVIIKD